MNGLQIVRLGVLGLVAVPLLAACGSHDDKSPSAQVAPNHESVKLTAPAAKGEHYCAHIKASKKHPGVVHVINCGNKRLNLNYEKHGGTVKPGQKVTVKPANGNYHGFRVDVTGPHDLQLGGIILQ